MESNGQAVDDTIGIKSPGSREASQVTHIINIRLEWVFPKCSQTKSGTNDLVKKVFLIKSITNLNLGL